MMSLTSLWTAVLGAEGAHLPIALALAAARTVPLAWLAPVLGGPRVAPSFRVGLGVLLALLCVPSVAAGLPSAIAASAHPIAMPGAATLVLVGLREVLVGATIGFCVGAMFRAAESAGALVDGWRGAPVGEAASVVSGERASPISDLYLLMAVLVFFELGGVRILASALARSYEAVPVLGPGPGARALRPAAELVVACVGKLIASAVGLAAPVLVGTWLADVALGLIARAVPQIPLRLAAAPARALLGLGAVLLAVGSLDAALGAGFAGWVTVWQRAIAVWSRG